MSALLQSYLTLSKWKDLLLLGKVRLSFSVVFSAGAGYLVATSAFEWKTFLSLVLGGLLITMAANAFNQIIEKDIDARMARTSHRPLPAGRLTLAEAYLAAILLSLAGVFYLFKVNSLTAAFGVASLLLYVFAYTPLKGVTPFAVFVGAIPGAMPFMLGWVAATGRFGIEPGTLFAIQFLWQFAHFWAIAWILHDDYLKVNYILLPSGNPDARSSFQILMYSIAVVIASVLPVFHFTGKLHLSVYSTVGILVIGFYFVRSAFELHKKPTKYNARKVMRTSIIYLTLMQVIYVMDKYLLQ
ncbi:protoheme IX farnesyltransferase [Thermaurantimonas aggregans]|uniref:Protoheme IX farnesyltransferase n=1 Tax=Thermaurantimonas aggregans TaxID=2173829 RepID=A0A401XKW1_9FLAO|nr:heme o synthase [Thermaurantimonas aggregans]MCX8148209.1 heme o synthase [Thermaurantimonas aggregans]GCD77638.1 protoheme IX farnesyltransferase [Thermaurantimonas aggregans]